MHTKDLNPYASPSQESRLSRHDVAVTAFTLILLLATLFVLWWSVPPILRAIQIFPKSDLRVNILRLISSTLFVLGTILYFLATISCWRLRWRRLVLSLLTGTTSVVIGSLIVRVYIL